MMCGRFDGEFALDPNRYCHLICPHTNDNDDGDDFGHHHSIGHYFDYDDSFVCFLACFLLPSSTLNRFESVANSIVQTFHFSVTPFLFMMILVCLASCSRFKSNFLFQR